MRTAVVVAALALVACTGAGPHEASVQGRGVDSRPPNGTGQKPAFPEQTRAPERKANVAFDVVTVAKGLEHPWGLTFLPDGRMLVTDRRTLGSRARDARWR